MKILVGLGNPGRQYENNAHNIGFKVLDEFAKQQNIKFSKKGFKSVYGEGKIDGEKILLIKPQTYMNLSGEALLLLKKKFKDAKILVLVDDIDTQKGTIRYREKGSGGTHNGLRSIVSMIGPDFERLKFGVGKPEGDLKDFVLGNLDEQLKQSLISQGIERILQWLQ